MSGGEPFLRADLPEICDAAVTYCRPAIINIPSNGLLPTVIESSVQRILQTLNATRNTILIVNLSLDGLGAEHDEIRNVKGNFESLIDTYKRLERLRSTHSRLRLGIHSVVSKFNVNSLLRVYEYAKALQPDSYITEIAEERSELFNIGADIEPSSEDYTRFVKELSARVSNDFKHLNGISGIIQSFRNAYYEIVSEWLKEREQIIPCYAAYASCQIASAGDVWPCCVLGYEKPLGNLRESNYDFKVIWLSKRAEEIRAFIRKKGCSCPLANAHYTNMLCNLSLMTRIMKDTLL